MATETQPCRICGDESSVVGSVHGRYSGRDYTLMRCTSCAFGFIADPWLDYQAIYDERYYRGEGADPLVDYYFELEWPQRTVRRYEWEGIARCVGELTGKRSGLRWLDYGCGNGGLVRYVRARDGHDALGYETGAIVSELIDRDVPVVGADDLNALAGQLDVVTAIEVLEHTLDPLAELRRMRALLKTGGLLFLTTGNAAPFADRLTTSSYVVPEIHISFFEPRTLEHALRLAGFVPQPRRSERGFDLILKFKVLKNLRIRRRSLLTDLLPARLFAIADHRTRLFDHPIGWAQ